MYVLEGKTITGGANAVNQDTTTLWHLRLGHVSEYGLLELNKKRLLGSNQISKLEFCEKCVLGKSSSSSTQEKILPKKCLNM